MTEEEAVAIAREFIRAKDVSLIERVCLVVDGDKQLLESERRAGQKLPEEVRNLVQGKFFVHFRRLPPFDTMDPSTVIVGVDVSTRVASGVDQP